MVLYSYRYCASTIFSNIVVRCIRDIHNLIFQTWIYKNLDWSMINNCYQRKIFVSKYLYNVDESGC